MKWDLGVWAPAAHPGDCSCSSPQVRENQVRERGRYRRTQEVDISFPLCKKRIEGRRGIHNTGCCEVRVYETYPGEDRGQVSEQVELTAVPQARYKEEAAD